MHREARVADSPPGARSAKACTEPRSCHRPSPWVQIDLFHSIQRFRRSRAGPPAARRPGPVRRPPRGARGGRRGLGSALKAGLKAGASNRARPELRRRRPVCQFPPPPPPASPADPSRTTAAGRRSRKGILRSRPAALTPPAAVPLRCPLSAVQTFHRGCLLNYLYISPELSKIS